MKMESSLFKAFLLFIFINLLVVAFVSCGENSGNSSQSNTPIATNANTAYEGGKKIYQTTCGVCHQADGKGTPGAFPPLAGSDYLLANKFRAIRQIIKGSSGKITVNGTDINGVMPPQPLNDSDIANVLNYVYHSFGNNGFTVSTSEVKSVRDTIK
jgi:mono/diheme cytochrome c family protein